MVENLPKITIITATFNIINNKREVFLRECIESVHNQTYKNIEHLIIDGNSKDGTIDLIKEYENKGWVKFYSEPDEGMCDAMNKGIKKSSGEYIGILNSDDLYATNKAIELSVKSILESNADYSYSECNVIERDSKKLLWTWTTSKKNFNNFFIEPLFNHETMLCKKSIYEKENYYEYKKYGTACDIYFLLKLILNDYKKVFIDTPILNFRIGGETNTISSNNHKKQSQKVYLDLWKEFINKEDLKEICQEFNENKDISEIKTIFTYSNLKKLKKFICKKNLKNFDYYSFDRHIKRIIKNSDILDKKWYKKFINYFISLLKIRG